MNGALASVVESVIPLDVHEFAQEMGISAYLNDVIELARQGFPSSPVRVSLGQDSEEERHRYIALDVEVAGKTAEDLLAGQRVWSVGIGKVCPSWQAVYFVLGWR